MGELVRSVMADSPVTVLQGGRQTGKSTLVAEIAREVGVQVYTMDDEDLRAAALADPVSFIDSLGDGLIVLDEVQRAPGLVLPIKAAVDRQRRPGRFLLTGFRGPDTHTRSRGLPRRQGGHPGAVPLLTRRAGRNQG